MRNQSEIYICISIHLPSEALERFVTLVLRSESKDLRHFPSQKFSRLGPAPGDVLQNNFRYSKGLYLIADRDHYLSYRLPPSFHNQNFP